MERCSIRYLGTVFQVCQDGKMKKSKRVSERREEALSHEGIVEAAIALLDREGESGLTFRALAAQLATGSGAIYWHVANKSELLAAANDVILARAMSNVDTHDTPENTIRRIAAALFEAIDAHPWVGAQLSLAPWRTAALQIFERVGRQVQAMGVSGGACFTSASVLVSYIIGVSVQNAGQGRALTPPMDRADFLKAESARWEALGAHEYPFLQSVATQLRKHDDHAEFLAGIDLILAGITASL